MTEPLDPKTLIAPTFYKVFDDIILEKYTHYWLKGGRGSTKSSFISLMIVLDVYETFVRFRYHQVTPADLANAICFRKVGSTLRHSVLPQIKWALDKLGLTSFFTETSSTFEFTLKYTGQKIILTGCDDPQKIKSIKPAVGYFKDIWFEELAEFSGMEEIRTILQSVMRGASRFRAYYSYNPPMTVTNWVNFESNVPHEKRLVHHSSYLDVPKEWLGQTFFDEADRLKKNNKRAYEHEYLGIPTGTGGTVFENIEAREITDEEIKHFDRIKQGLDWGFAVDPVAFVRLHYDSTRKIIYLIDEIYSTHMFNNALMDEIRKRGYQNESIIADSAEPKSCTELWDNGFYCYKADKGAGSVAYGIKFLQRLNKIVIDPKRTPNAYKEFTLYEYERNKDGTFRPDYPDKNNHCFVEDTLVTTLEGYKKIKYIKRGDKVLTRRGFQTVQWAGVSGVNMKVVTLKTKLGRSLTCTPEHLIFANKEWKEAQYLKNENLYIENLKCHRFLKPDWVKSVEYAGYATKVYDITVENYHEFFANGILVHNCIDATRYAIEKDMREGGIF